MILNSFTFYCTSFSVTSPHWTWEWRGSELCRLDSRGDWTEVGPAKKKIKFKNFFLFLLKILLSLCSSLFLLPKHFFLISFLAADYEPAIYTNCKREKKRLEERLSLGKFCDFSPFYFFFLPLISCLCLKTKRLLSKKKKINFFSFHFEFTSKNVNFNFQKS